MTDEEILEDYKYSIDYDDLDGSDIINLMALARAEGKKEGIAESEKERPKHFNIDYKERFEKVLKELKDCHRTNKAFYENGVADGQKKRCGK